MAIARVNTASASLQGTSNVPCTTGNFVSTTGNLLVVGVRSAHALVLDTLKNAAGADFTTIASITGGVDPYLYIAYMKNITGNATDNVTATFTGSAGGGQYAWVEVVQYSGLDVTSPLDATANSSGALRNTANTDQTTSSFSTAQASEVVVVFASGAGLSDFSAGTDFTLVANDFTGFKFAGVEEYITSGTLSGYTAHITQSVNQAAVIAWACFKATAAGTKLFRRANLALGAGGPFFSDPLARV